jgi:hypothetical protein
MDGQAASRVSLVKIFLSSFSIREEPDGGLQPHAYTVAEIQIFIKCSRSAESRAWAGTSSPLPCTCMSVHRTKMRAFVRFLLPQYPLAHGFSFFSIRCDNPSSFRVTFVNYSSTNLTLAKAPLVLFSGGVSV